MSFRTPVKTRSHTKRLLSNSVKSERKVKRGRFSRNKIVAPNPDKNNMVPVNAQMQIDKLNHELLHLRQTHAHQLEQYNVELTNLRKLNQAQNEQLTTLRQKLTEVPGNNSHPMIQALIDGMRAIQIDVKPPKFDDLRNPHSFLEKLEKFFQLKQISRENRLDILDGVFEDRAKLWYETQNLLTNDEFKRKFLHEFYSIPVRVQIKATWLAKRFNPGKDKLHSYFLKSEDKSKTLNILYRKLMIMNCTTLSSSSFRFVYVRF